MEQVKLPLISGIEWIVFFLYLDSVMRKQFILEWICYFRNTGAENSKQIMNIDTPLGKISMTGLKI